MHKNLKAGKTVMLLFRALALATLFVNLSFATTIDPRYVNEKRTLSAMRQLYKAQMTYAREYGNGNFSSLRELGQVAIIDYELAGGFKHRYVFNGGEVHSTAIAIASFEFWAMPERYSNKFGKRSFYTDTWGQIRGGDHGGLAASATDPVVDDCSTGSIEDNERFALYAMQYFRSAQNNYMLRFGNYGTLQQLAASGRIDPRLGSGFNRGYVYQVTKIDAIPGVPPSYFVNAMPYPYGTAGVRSFYLDQTGVIRGADRNGTASNENDPPITVFP